MKNLITELLWLNQRQREGTGANLPYLGLPPNHHTCLRHIRAPKNFFMPPSTIPKSSLNLPLSFLVFQQAFMNPYHVPETKQEDGNGEIK